MAKASNGGTRKRVAARQVSLLQRAAGLVASKPARRGPALALTAARARTRSQIGALLLFAVLVLLGWQPAAQWASGVVTDTIGTAAGVPATVSVHFAKCSAAGQQDCVVDGDTLRFSGWTVRVADIDAPETRDYKCASEKARGDRATQRLLQLVNAGPFAVEGYERDTDVYGRKLRILARNGKSLGGVLVDEGLARAWDGARHPWC